MPPPPFALGRLTRLLCGLGLVSGAMVVTLPAGAEIISVGFDPSGLPTLSATEQERLDGLLAVQKPQILSTLSPDGKTLIIALASRLDPNNRTLHFLDVTTGDISEAVALQYEVLAPDLPLRWVDKDTVRFVQQDAFGPWEILTINRNSGIVLRTQIYPTQAETGEILGISPDFSKLVLRLYEGEEDGIYVVFIPSLQRLEVARLPQGLAIQPPAWSAQGDRMVLVTASLEERGLYDRTPDSPSLANPVIQDALGRVPPADNIFRQQNAVRVFDFSQPDPLQVELTPATHGGDLFAQARFSPSGAELLVKLYRPAQVIGRAYPTYLFPEAAYYEVYDLKGNRLDRIDFPALQGPYESGGEFLGRDRLVFWATVGHDRPLFVYNRLTHRLDPLPLPGGSVDPNALVVTESGDAVIYGFSSVTQPPELFRLSTRDGASPQPLTSLNAALAPFNRVRYDPVRLATAQGDLTGFLVQPAGNPFPPRQVPIVFWQQGGPGFSITNEFATEVEMPLNLLPNFGLPVLAMALSGREGFGPDFFRAQADGQNFGRLDLAEGQAVVQHMIQTGWTRPDQVGITGCSYGGYYAAQMISQFPTLFAAANPQCLLIDLLTEWQLGYASLLSYLMGQTPLEKPTAFLELSPLYQATAIRTPTLMFHGAEDFLPIDLVRNFHDVLAAGGIPVTLYEFEGMGHSLSDPTFQRLAAQLQIDFFRRYLQPE